VATTVLCASFAIESLFNHYKTYFIKMVIITKSLSFMASAACLSTMLFMSSCSKDDAVTPSPEMAISKIESAGGSNLKFIGLDKVPPTIGQTGLGSLPVGYTKTSSNTVAGLSSYGYLFGNSEQPWIPAINSLPNSQPGRAGTFLTLGATKSNPSRVHVNIKNLSQGKKYKFTYYVSTMAIKNLSESGQTPYASHFSFTYDTPSIGIGQLLYFAGNENQWIARSKEFYGNSSATVDFGINLYGENSNATSYGNVFIPEGAIQEVK
jgi:hypothetical protein